MASNTNLCSDRKLILRLWKLDDKHCYSTSKPKSLDSVTKGGGYRDIYGTYLV